MTREFKPGAAAVVRCNELSCPDAEHAAIVGKLGDWYILGLGEYLHDVEPVRPLVVIDPEDREQVERLIGEMKKVQGQGPADVIDRWQLALREFANPTPEIEEPTGLGAVVEDAEGKWYVRTGEWKHPWIEGHASLSWSEFSAVRVLSEGVAE